MRISDWSSDVCSSDLRAAVLDDARAHPENRLADAVACELTLASRSGEFPFAPFFAGLLDVPEAEGSRKFCAALIEAVIDGDFSQADQNAFQTPSDVSGRGRVVALLTLGLNAPTRRGEKQAGGHQPDQPRRACT